MGGMCLGGGGDVVLFFFPGCFFFVAFFCLLVFVVFMFRLFFFLFLGNVMAGTKEFSFARACMHAWTGHLLMISLHGSKKFPG